MGPAGHSVGAAEHGASGRVPPWGGEEGSEGATKAPGMLVDSNLI